MFTLAQIDAIFRLMDEGLRRAATHTRKGLKPIAIEVATSPRVIWSFDPGHPDRLFTPGRHPRPALTVACSAAFLERLLSSEALDTNDDFLFFGDIGALEALVKAITPPVSLNAARFGAQT